MMDKVFGKALLVALLLAACSGGERALLPVQNAPLRQTPADVPSDGIIRLAADDTIYTLANRYRLTPRQIILTNRLAPPYDLAGRATITLPQPRSHKVIEGDTIHSISSRYRVSIADIARLNALTEPYDLRVGMSIAIPRQIDYDSIDGGISDTASGSTASGTASSSTVTSTASSSTVTSTPSTATVSDTSTASTTPVRRGTITTNNTPAESIEVRFSNAGGGFSWPVDGTITGQFGTVSRGIRNDGVKIGATAGTPVVASMGGEVAFVGSGLKSFGNLVLIKHDDGWITAYAHLGNIAVAEGQTVSKGASIGTIGASGNAITPQLHFELRRGRTPVNPQEYLS